MKKFIVIFLIIVSSMPVFASEFEELDKIPEGAHEGQMLLGGFVSIGMPFGDLITAEDDFLMNNYYYFSDSEITKELIVNHLSFDLGASFEYMPIDHVGIKSKVRFSTIVQRTAFGSNYENWSANLFSIYSILLGPAFHLTNRKQWDVTLTPVIGYYLGEYEATPIASKLVVSYDGDGKRDVSGLVFGTELNLTIYFSGGLYLSLGGEYSYYSVSFDPAYSLTQNGNTYSADSGGAIQTVNIVISAGYAFSN